MPPKPKVKIYFSEEQKRKDLQQKGVVNNGGGKKPAAPIRKPNAAGRSKNAPKVVKSARRPIQKATLPKRLPKFSDNFNMQKKQVQQQKPDATKPAKSSKSAIAFQTAKVIAQNNSHPRQKEVAELMKTLERGWIDRQKFDELLKKLII